MASTNLEQRLEDLELRVDQLQIELRSAQLGAAGVARDKDWRRTIGAITDDEGMKAIFQEAMRLREEDRRQARSRGGNGRKREQ
ncbi:MAG: hypothetical protein KY475_16060 [Planctomycetes bacterium]|nr:hypothetical protein [Planctomycetota bacterium]